MGGNSIKSRGIGIKLYIIGVLFATLCIFLQILPIETSRHFQTILAVNSAQFVNYSSLFFILYALMQIPGGMLFDKYGVKYVLPISLFITIIGIALYWYSSSLLMIGISRLITGLGCSVAYIGAAYIATLFFPSRVLPIMIAIIEAVSTAGSFIATSPLKWLIDTFGWNNAGVISILYVVSLFIGALLTVKMLPKIGKNKSTPSISLAEIFSNILEMLRNRKIILIMLYSFCTWMIIMSFAGYWLKDYLVEVHNFSYSKALNFVNLYWGSFLVASLVVGSITHNTVNAVITMLILSICGFSAYTFMGYPVLLNDSYIMLVMVLGGISASGVIIAFSIIPTLVPKKYACSAISLNNMCVVLGGYVGQILFGVLLKFSNVGNYIINDSAPNLHYYSAVLIYLVAAFIGLIIAIIIARDKIYLPRMSFIKT